MRRALILTLVCAATAACALPAAAAAGGGPRDNKRASLRDRVDDLQQEIESLTEDIEDLGEPVEEFELFDQCAYTIGVTQHGTWGGGKRVPLRAGRDSAPAGARDGHARVRQAAV